MNLAHDKRANGGGASDLRFGLYLMFSIAKKSHPVKRRRFQYRQRALVDVAGDGKQYGVNCKQKHSDKDSMEHLSGSGACAHNRRTPESGCGIQPVDTPPVLHDGPGTKKTHSGNQIPDDLSRSWSNGRAKVHETCGGETHQRVGAQAGGALTPLALGADTHSQNHRQQKARKRRVQERFRVRP
jgi:hypothetical protein